MAESKNLLIKGIAVRELGIEELRTEIAQCLQFENLNFLIGAGCSSFYVSDTEKAMPTMAALTTEFYEINPDFTTPDGNNARDRFPNNLEALINYLMSIYNVCDESEKGAVFEKVSIINKFIFDKICHAEECKELLIIYKIFYQKIVKKTRQTPVNIFTTNYDLYNEMALDSLSYMYNNGFMGSTKRIFNPNAYNYVMVENLNLSKDIWKSVSNFINLYKIHGSINWVKEPSSTTDMSIIVEKDLEVIRARNDYKSLMIYPTPQKDRSTLMVPYSDLFRMMQNSLLKSNSTLITMGYSFSDEHINRIILNALSVYNFRLVIFGDSPKIQELQDIGDSRIWIIKSDEKIHYFKNIVELVLPQLDDEQLEAQKLRESLNKLASVLTNTPARSDENA